MRIFFSLLFPQIQQGQREREREWELTGCSQKKREREKKALTALIFRLDNFCAGQRKKISARWRVPKNRCRAPRRLTPCPFFPREREGKKKEEREKISLLTPTYPSPPSSLQLSSSNWRRDLFFRGFFPPVESNPSVSLKR